MLGCGKRGESHSLIDAHVDLYVMATKGEGYPIILGRPWLIAVKADQKWGAGTLVIKKDGPIVYDLKQGKQVNIKYESTSDQESNEDTTTSDEDSTSYEDESSMEVMGLVFRNKKDVYSWRTQPSTILSLKRRSEECLLMTSQRKRRTPTSTC